MKKVGRVGIKALVYFEVISSLALVIGLVVANLVRPGSGIQHGTSQTNQVSEIARQAESFSWGDFISHIVPSNIFDSFAQRRYTADIIFQYPFCNRVETTGSFRKNV